MGKKVKVKLSLYSPWWPLGLSEVEAPTIYRHSGHRCQPYAPAAFYPQENSWYSFLLEAVVRSPTRRCPSNFMNVTM
jgi:hypothetical protein